MQEILIAYAVIVSALAVLAISGWWLLRKALLALHDAIDAPAHGARAALADVRGAAEAFLYDCPGSICSTREGWEGLRRVSDFLHGLRDRPRPYIGGQKVRPLSDLRDRVLRDEFADAQELDTFRLLDLAAAHRCLSQTNAKFAQRLH